MSVTTETGSYSVQSYSPDKAVITVALPMVVDGAISPTKTFVPTITLDWTVGGNWSVSDLSSTAVDSGELANSVAFTGGC